MKFYFYDRNGKSREMQMDEVQQHLSQSQIDEGIEAKKADPLEEVSYMTIGGYIVIDF